MLTMGTPTSIPPIMKNTATKTTILLGVDTTTKIIMDTSTILNHIKTVMSTEKITGITSIRTPAMPKRRMPTHHNQPTSRTGAYPAEGRLLVFSEFHDRETAPPHHRL